MNCGRHIVPAAVGARQQPSAAQAVHWPPLPECHNAGGRGLRRPAAARQLVKFLRAGATGRNPPCPAADGRMAASTRHLKNFSGTSHDAEGLTVARIVVRAQPRSNAEQFLRRSTGMKPPDEPVIDRGDCPRRPTSYVALTITLGTVESRAPHNCRKPLPRRMEPPASLAMESVSPPRLSKSCARLVNRGALTIPGCRPAVGRRHPGRAKPPPPP